MISIKDVTKETGITVRTLRHYDHIGLLPPAGKTEGGHRLYGEVELQKLQEIQFLKTLGFSLQEIKDMLSNRDWDWAECLRNQLNVVLQENERLTQIASILRGLLNAMTIDGQINILEIQKLILLFQKNKDKREMYRNQMFRKTEKELLDLLPNVNSGDPDSLEWVALLGQLKRYRKEGADSLRVQRMIRRMYEKQEETFGDDNDGFLDKLWEIRKSPEQSQKVGFYPIEPDVLDFLEKASEIYINEQKHRQER